MKCFHCAGGLCNWELGDEPWMEHAKWYSNCPFIEKNKSYDFIKNCKELGEFELQNIDNTVSSEFKSLESDIEDEDNDLLRYRTIKEWLNSDFVRKLKNFDEEIIEEVLERRWRQTKTFYTCFEESYSSVSQWKGASNNQIEQNKSLITNLLNIFFKWFNRFWYFITRSNN